MLPEIAVKITSYSAWRELCQMSVMWLSSVETNYLVETQLWRVLKEGSKGWLREEGSHSPPLFSLLDKWRETASVLLMMRSWLEAKRNVWSDSPTSTWSGLAEYTADRKGTEVVQRSPTTVYSLCISFYFSYDFLHNFIFWSLYCFLSKGAWLNKKRM